MAKLCGYKVLASCSPGSAAQVKSLGADATFDYKIPIDQQLKEIEEITGSKLTRAFDASAMSTETGMKALAASSAEIKYFATTNDWYVHPL